MALQGSLADLDVTDLLRLVMATERSGELMLASLDSFARLRFSRGQLVEASGADRGGLELLRTVTAWHEGEFEFRARVEGGEPVTDESLHQAAEALLVELGARLEPQVRVPSREAPVFDATRSEVLAQFVASHSFARYACTLDPDLVVNAEAAAGTMAPPEIRKLATAVGDFIQSYPRTGIRRFLIEDEVGIVVTCLLEDGASLMVVADLSATLGTATAAVGKLAVELGSPTHSPTTTDRG